MNTVNHRLTDTEYRILKLLSKGWTLNQISEELLMESSQVERCKRCIYEKFEVNDEDEAIEKAFELGITI